MDCSWLGYFKSLLIIFGIDRWHCKPIYYAMLSKMEQHALKNVNSCSNTKIYSYLETFVGQSSNQYLNVVHF
jgi:hypothetical protein